MNVVAMASQPELYGTAYPGPWVTECSTDELLECYSEWEPEVTEMLKVSRRYTQAIHAGLCER